MDAKRSHQSAEKKRREAIRKNFDVLTMALPNLEMQNARSEALVIGRCVEVIKELDLEFQQLKVLEKNLNQE